MAKHEEQRFTATFQCFESKFHKIGAEPFSLAIRAHRERCQHYSVNAIAALLFHPDPREDDVSEQSCRILRKPFSENAPIVAKSIEKCRCSFGIVIPEGLSNQCSSGSVVRRRSFAESYIHWASLSLLGPRVHREASRVRVICVTTNMYANLQVTPMAGSAEGPHDLAGRSPSPLAQARTVIRPAPCDPVPIDLGHR